MAPRRIGELLVAEGLLTEGAVQRALGYQRLSGERIKIGSILLNWDLLGEDVLLASLAKLHRCAAVTWEMLLATPVETIRLLPAAQAIRIGAIPWSAEKGVIRVAFANPSNLASLDEVASLTGRRVVPGVTTEARLLQAQQRYYGRHIPLEYRPILQKLDRRSTTSAKVERDFRSSDLVQAERDSVTLPPPRLDASPGVPIPVADGATAPPPAGTTRRDSALELPEFPDIPPAPDSLAAALASADEAAGAASIRDSHPRSPHDGGEDELTDWVGDALSAFTGGPGTDTARIDAADAESSAGVSDPSLFGREGRESHAFMDDPGALDQLPATNALRDRPRPPVRRAAPRAAEPDSLPSEAHTRGIPTSIPPFRRATDPAVFESTSFPVENDEVAAGMWKAAPEEEGAASVDSPSATLDSVAGARRRDEIADSLLEGALETLPRVLLLASGRNGVTGWRGRGPGMTADTVSAIRVPVSEISIFSSVQESGVPHFGSVDPAEWPRNLVAIFGAAPPDCAIFPIRILDGVAAFLYADRLGAPMQYEDFAIVARASASAANVLSRFLLRSDRAGSPVPS